MKLSELEDADQVVSREYLEQALAATLAAKLARAEITTLNHVMDSERHQRIWIFGLGALAIFALFHSVFRKGS